MLYTIYLLVIGGDEGARTPYLSNANAALYQMSYIPSKYKQAGLPTELV